MLGDVPIVESSALPIYPSDGEDARRIVRHGLADVLEWPGEKVGPKPGEPTMAMLVDGAIHVAPGYIRLITQHAEAILGNALRDPSPVGPFPAEVHGVEPLFAQPRPTFWDRYR